MFAYTQYQKFKKDHASGQFFLHLFLLRLSEIAVFKTHNLDTKIFYKYL